MAEIEEPRFTTLAERIAALNQQKNFEAPPPSAGKRAPPPPPPLRAASTEVSNETTSASSAVETRPAIPPRPTGSSTTGRAPPPLPRRTPTDPGNGEQPSAPLPGRPVPPPLPSRTSQQSTPPQLPSRRPSAQTLPVRRNSNSSDISSISTVSAPPLNLKSSASGAPSETQTLRRLPPLLEPAKLPPLPPTRRELDAKAKETAETAPSIPPRRIADPPRPSVLPRLPSRPPNAPEPVQPQESSPAIPPRRLPPPPSSFRTKSTLENGFGSDAPPPVPLNSRPTLAQIDAVASRVVSTPPPPPLPPKPPSDISVGGGSCLTCRDFSAPDRVAAQHPISSLPRSDPIGHLARVLCGPFASATDKARAIFTWCHHNILYDVDGFFNNCIPRGQTPADTIFSGKAVCEGYARVYEAVASRAGLACAVVTGHGKGFGFSPLRKGQPCPPRNATGHAWNAVRIDGGEWKLIDACWGAGSIAQDQRSYDQHFSPEFFTMSNEHFGSRHYPADDRHWYRADGRCPSWEEYMVGPLGGDEPAMWLGDATNEGLDQFNFAPAQKSIAVYGGQKVVGFRFAKICPHWDPERNGRGKQMLFVLKIGGVDGRKDDLLPLEYDGFWYYIDVNARELGAPGQTVSLVGFTEMDGRSARGLTKDEWFRKKGRVGFSYAILVRWDLV